MDQGLFDTVLRVTKDYWFLITLVASVVLTLAYMIVFRVNPWTSNGRRNCGAIECGFIIRLDTPCSREGISPMPMLNSKKH